MELMNFIESSNKIRRLLATESETDPNDWFLCLRARYGMAVVFDAVYDLLGDGEVLTTPYTCITAINPILVSGLTPVYVDIKPELLSNNTVPAKLVSHRTRAIVSQNTLGLIGDRSALDKIADEHKIPLIEDSAHCLLRMARNHRGRIIADISVHTFGVEKVIAGTKFGGAIYVNPDFKQKAPKLYEEICHRLINLPQPTGPLKFRIKSYKTINAIMQRMPHAIKPHFRNFAVKTKLLEPPVSEAEQEGRQLKPMNTNEYVNEVILKNLPYLRSIYDKREKNVEIYNQELYSEKFIKIAEHSSEPLLAYPIIFDDIVRANYAYDLLTTAGFFIRRWYSPLLYPGPKYYQFYHYKPEQCPIAEEVSKRTLCLPTDQSPERTRKIIQLINSVQKPVEKNSQDV